jgi:hypothetical protein
MGTALPFEPESITPFDGMRSTRRQIVVAAESTLMPFFARAP